MEKLDSILRRAQEGISRRQLASSALAARLNSEGLPCRECQPPKGLIQVGGPGVEGLLWIACPARQDASRCRLARGDEEKVRSERARWLRQHGLGRLYHGMEIGQVDGRARETVAGYLDGISAHVLLGQGLLISGEPGTGKTSILALAMEAARDAGITDAWFVYCQDLYASFYRRDDEARAKIGRWRECQLLLLDEFGAAYGHDFPASESEGFCEHRQADRLATCVTTNLSIKAIRADPQWTRIYDRWRSICWGIELRGPSRRRALEGKP